MIRVHNVTRNVDLITAGQMADTFWPRLKGLIGRKALAQGEGLVIRPSKGVHMWFMRFPIDVIYVNEQDEVVDLDEHLQPWQIGKPRSSARYVIEVPAGTVKRTGTQRGDRLRLEEAPAQHPA